jgi:phosphoribosylformylglycinamidine synthase
MVQTQTVMPPGDNAPVLKVHGTQHHVSASTDGNGLYCYVDPYEGGKLAVAESARNVACTGAQPLAITNCLNFGSPLKPEVFFQLSEAVRGIGDACTALNTPVTGGNVSLYNENPDGAIWPTPVVGMVGKIAHPAKPVSAGFKNAGDHIILLGEAAEHLGASEILRWKTGKEYLPCPSCDLNKELNVINLLVEANAEGLLKSAHDCSVGGLAVTLSECLLKGTAGVGAQVSIKELNTDPLIELFAETAPRVIVSISDSQVNKFTNLCEKHGVPIHALGLLTSDPSLKVETTGGLLDWKVDSLESAHESTDSIFPRTEVEVPLH